MSALEVASLFGTLDLRDSATGVLRAFRGDLDATEARLNRIGGAMQGVGLGISAITAPLVAFGVSGVQVASDFENAMAEISARAGIVGEDLQRISDFALQMGADTSFSAQQAADAFLQLLTSGQSASEAMATLPAVLDAAAASGEDLGRTADLVTDILAAFGLQVEDAASVVDALARAAGASSADMASLGQGFSNVGPIARQFNISVEQTAAILAVFAENGIKGAEAGTQLRSMLTAMTRDTDATKSAWARLGTSMYDATGQVRPIIDVLNDIRRGLDGMTEEQRIATIQDLAGAFGQMGLSALTSADSLSAMLELMGGSASAAEVAAARMNTFSGRVEALRGSIETLQIRAMTPLMNAMKPFLERATEIVNRVSEWVEANPDLTASIIQLVGAVASLGGGLTLAGTAIKLMAPALALLLGPVGMVAAGIAATVVGFAAFASVLGVDVLGGLEVVSYHLQNFLADIGENGLGGALRNFFTAFEDGSSRVAGILQGFGMGREQAEAFANEINRIAQQVILFVEALPANLSLVGFYFQYYFGMIWSRVQPVVQPLIDWLTGDGEDSLQGAVTSVANWIDAYIVKPLQGIWRLVEPYVQDIVDWFNNDVAHALRAVEKWIYDNITLPLQNLWAQVQPHLEPIITWFETRFAELEVTIAPFFRRIEDFIDNLRIALTLLNLLGGGTGLPTPDPRWGDVVGEIGNPGGGGSGKILPPGGKPKFPPLVDDWGKVIKADGGSAGSRSVSVNSLVVNVNGGDPEEVRMAVWQALEDLGSEG
jgi:TP901 family phage tail tape measure protein